MFCFLPVAFFLLVFRSTNACFTEALLLCFSFMPYVCDCPWLRLQSSEVFTFNI